MMEYSISPQCHVSFTELWGKVWVINKGVGWGGVCILLFFFSNNFETKPLHITK